MSFGGWAISEELYGWLVEHVPVKATILELGSGAGTEELLKRWRVVSVEHDERYLGAVEGAEYVHAPLEGGWYRTEAVQQAIDSAGPYAALLVDGPPGLTRHAFISRMDLFSPSVPWLFDDMHRMSDLRHAAKVASRRNTQLHLHLCADGKEFGVIHPEP